MRLGVLALAALLSACAAPTDNAADNAAENAAAGAGAQDASEALAGEAVVENEAQSPPAPPGAPSDRQPPGPAPQPAPEPATSVSLTASPDSARAGATVTLRLANGSRDRVGYNLCSSTLQSAGGAAVATDRICTMELRTLEPGRSASYAYDLPAGLAPGSYRFSTQVAWLRTNRSSTVTSNAIRVAGR